MNNNNKRPSALLSTSSCSTTTTTTTTVRKRRTTEDNTAVVMKNKFVGTLMGLPISVRVHILNYLGETQEELRALTLISKQFNIDCKQSGIVFTLIPVFIVSPSSQHGVVNDKRRSKRFFQNLRHYQQNSRHYQQLERYRHMIVKEVHKFGLHTYNSGIIERMVHNLPMVGIILLDISSPSLPARWKYSLPYALSYILPNLRFLDLSNTRFSTNGGIILDGFSRRCPHLEKISLNNIYNGNNIITLDGLNMMYSTNTLREINMDGSFSSSITVVEMGILSDLNRFPHIFLFHKCCNVLERASIRNVKYYRGRSIPQNALIKFVRNAPTSMRWFRSNLTKENMLTLRKERPEIQLLN